MIKNQHYVPRMYLRNFCIDGENDKCYEFNSKSKKIEVKSIEKICAMNYLNEIRNEEGAFVFPEGVNKLEEAFGKIESGDSIFFKDLFYKLDLCKENSILLTKDEIEGIKGFILLTILRNPLSMEMIPDVLQDFIHKPIDDRASKKYAWQLCLDRILEQEIEENAVVEIEILVTNEERPFITTSIPFYINVERDGYFVYMPLTYKYAVVVKNANILVKNLNKCLIKNVSSDIDRYNEYIVNRRCMSIISNDKNAINKWAQVYKILY